MSEAVYKSIERYWIARAQVAEAERDALAEKLARAVEALEIVSEGHPKDYTDNYTMADAALAAIKEGGA